MSRPAFKVKNPLPCPKRLKGSLARAKQLTIEREERLAEAKRNGLKDRCALNVK